MTIHDNMGRNASYIAGYIAALETRITKLEEMFAIVGLETTFVERFLALEQRIDTMESDLEDKISEAALNSALLDKVDNYDLEVVIDERVKELMSNASITIFVR